MRITLPWLCTSSMLWAIPNTEQQVGMEMTKNFQGGVSKSKWNFQGLIKKEVEFPGVIKKKICKVFRGLGS